MHCWPWCIYERGIYDARHHGLVLELFLKHQQQPCSLEV